MKNTILVATCVATITAFTVFGAAAQTTGPAAQDNMKTNDASGAGMKKDGMETKGMAKDSMSKESMSKDGMAKDGMSKEGMKKDGMLKQRGHSLKQPQNCDAQRRGGRGASLIDHKEPSMLQEFSVAQADRSARGCR
jgi:pentapeptide MXKDX repeat protein